jgi:hypothetical protein
MRNSLECCGGDGEKLKPQAKTDLERTRAGGAGSGVGGSTEGLRVQALHGNVRGTLEDERRNAGNGGSHQVGALDDAGEVDMIE